jgi:copper chaperone CopZ
LLIAVMAWAYRPGRAAAAGDCGCDDPVATTPAEAGTTDRVVLTVEGMNCSHCTASVERALGEQDGVRRVIVSLDERRAIVEGDGLEVARLAAAVNELGYTATPS